LKITEVAEIIWICSQNKAATFFHGKSYILISAKNGLGDIGGVFFKNSSGHRDQTTCIVTLPGGTQSDMCHHPVCQTENEITFMLEHHKE
jgi:hypothetical protein